MSGDSTSGEGEGPGSGDDISGSGDAPTPAETGHGVSDSGGGLTGMLISLVALGGLLGSGLALLRRQAR